MRRSLGLVLCLVAVGCGGKGSDPSPPTSERGTTVPGVTSTVLPAPKVTGDAISGLEAGSFHVSLEKSGFATAPAASIPGFTTTTSKRSDATISTYGKGASDVVKIVAEADRGVAATILAGVVATVVDPAESKKAEAWLKAELKKGPLSPTKPRTASATYAAVPYDLLVTGTTATLSIGRLTG